MKHLALLALLVCPLFAQTDGPATLPQTVMEVRQSFTPSSNLPTYVGPTGNLQAALTAARPGDRLVVDPSLVTTVTGKLILPNGQPGAWITVEPSSIAFLPDEYTRVTTTTGNMPKIVLASQSASIQGGQYVRLIGFEVTRPAGTGVVYSLFSALGHDVILDRLYVHGTAGDETNRGVILDNSYNVAVINSYFSDFHCLALVGACGDSQAISGGGSTVQDGNFYVTNNYLEAAGENIIFGGSPATQTPCDITIKYNTFNKPMSWNPKDPTFAPVMGRDGKPHPWIVKNLLELKNACRVLVEGNRMTDVWGGFTQVGASILLTPKNAAAYNPLNQSACPTCAVTDVTVRYNWISYAAQAMQVAYAKNDYGFYPADAGRFSIHDNIWDHLQYPTCYQCASFLNIVGGAGPAGALHDVSITQNSYALDTPGSWILPSQSSLASSANGFLNLNSAPVGVTPANTNMNFTNNIVEVGWNGIYTTGGGAANCWSVEIAQPYAVQFSDCWPGGSFTGNQLNYSPGMNPPVRAWPAGNFLNTPNPAAGANMTLVNAAIANQH